jgi:hypothetical protein
LKGITKGRDTPRQCLGKHLQASDYRLERKTGARTPCGTSARFPHSLPVTEGVKASIHALTTLGGGLNLSKKMPYPALPFVNTVSANCKKCVEHWTDVLTIRKSLQSW